MIPQDRMTPEGRMTQQRRAGAGTVRVLVLVGAAALLLAACASAAPSVSPSATPGASSPASVAPTASAAVVATPVPTVLPSASTPSTCPALPQSVALPSDRFTDLRVTGTTGADRLTFVFGDPSLPGPAGPPRGELEAAAPPYTSAGSGAPIAMTGDHVVVVRFSGMSLSNDAGQETYDGPTEIKPDTSGLRHAVLYDATEGVIGWYVGYDGPGCVVFARTGNDITLTIDHP
jgi:hypothetical protein